MKKREQMRMSNQKAREFLFAEGFDWLWFKSHEDLRKKSRGDYYYMALDKKAIRCLDPYNLFDGCAYDATGIFWWFQIKTNNWPDEKAIIAFSKGKMGCCIMAINVKPPKGKRKRYEVVTREYEDGQRIES